jgi:hypothetical protein
VATRRPRCRCQQQQRRLQQQQQRQPRHPEAAAAAAAAAQASGAPEATPEAAAAAGQNAATRGGSSRHRTRLRGGAVLHGSCVLLLARVSQRGVCGQLSSVWSCLACSGCAVVLSVCHHCQVLQLIDSLSVMWQLPSRRGVGCKAAPCLAPDLT